MQGYQQHRIVCGQIEFLVWNVRFEPKLRWLQMLCVPTHYSGIFISAGSCQLATLSGKWHHLTICPLLQLNETRPLLQLRLTQRALKAACWATVYCDPRVHGRTASVPNTEQEGLSAEHLAGSVLL